MAAWPRQAALPMVPSSLAAMTLGLTLLAADAPALQVGLDACMHAMIHPCMLPQGVTGIPHQTCLVHCVFHTISGGLRYGPQGRLKADCNEGGASFQTRGASLRFYPLQFPPAVAPLCTIPPLTFTLSTSRGHIISSTSMCMRALPCTRACVPMPWFEEHMPTSCSVPGKHASQQRSRALHVYTPAFTPKSAACALLTAAHTCATPVNRAAGRARCTAGSPTCIHTPAHTRSTPLNRTAGRARCTAGSPARGAVSPGGALCGAGAAVLRRHGGARHVTGVSSLVPKV